MIMYERKITLLCPECGIRNEEDIVEFLNIEEDMQGRDVLTFKCHYCGKPVKSLRYG